MNSTESRAAIALASIYVTRMLGLFMVMPVLAVLALGYADFSPLLLGLAIGGYGLTQACLQIPFGMLSDRIGRKPVIIAGLLLFASGSVLAALADSMLGLVIGRILQGAGAIAGAVMALAADVTREEQRPKVMAIIGISIGFSFYLALLFGPMLAEHSGLAGIFWATAGLSVLGIALVIWVVPSAVNVAPSADTLPRLSQLSDIVRDPQLLILNISVCLIHLLITLLLVQLPVLLSSFGIDFATQWQLYLPVLGVSVVGLVVLLRLAKFYPQLSLLLSVVCVAIPIVALLGFDIADVISLGVIVTVFFVGFNCLEASLPALVSGIAPAGSKGTAMGVYASWQFFGAFLGGLLSSLLASGFSQTLLYTVVIVVAVSWMYLLSRLPRQSRFKRVTLNVNFAHWSVGELSTTLRQLNGVADITIVPDEQVAYLKVDAKDFDLALAQQAIQNR